MNKLCIALVLHFSSRSTRLYPRKVFIVIAPFSLSRRSRPAEPDFTWEKTDKVEALKKDAGPLSEPEVTGAKEPLDG